MATAEVTCSAAVFEASLTSSETSISLVAPLSPERGGMPAAASPCP